MLAPCSNRQALRWHTNSESQLSFRVKQREINGHPGKQSFNLVNSAQANSRATQLPPSKIPSSSRQATKPAYPCTMPVNVAMMPQQIARIEIHLDGRNFFSTRLDGSYLWQLVIVLRSNWDYGRVSCFLIDLGQPYLAQNICDKEKRNSSLILLSEKPKVLLHAVKPSISNVYPINLESVTEIPISWTWLTCQESWKDTKAW